MRARLLAAALELFAQHGYAETTIDDIAERADVARQTVLNHFPRKRDFSLAWGEERRARLTDLQIKASPHVSTRDLLHQYFDALADMNDRERILTRAIHAGVAPAESLLHIRPVPDAVLATLERGQRRGDIRKTISVVAAAEIVTAVYSDTLTRWLTDGDPPFPLAPALTERLDLIITGLESI